ncbi:hypothetical protein BDK51DRAFT_29991 [Blyttiomyces helicus]|uniref:Uncharacterized protein n=1 Tax=Blyttiomyces helicus TaxID=388810 RepID=A0A4P9WSZ7_9FUNG|nr:hypothetical protein BDK51DRAFT_29991 [Blyttiomyces helicus]|eukprot:RKO94166.1 hypothetical protein BDK51DRAFT_29991 [Blyttiomyces helicus]
MSVLSHPLRLISQPRLEHKPILVVTWLRGRPRIEHESKINWNNRSTDHAEQDSLINAKPSVWGGVSWVRVAEQDLEMVIAFVPLVTSSDFHGMRKCEDQEFDGIWKNVRIFKVEHWKGSENPERVPRVNKSGRAKKGYGHQFSRPQGESQWAATRGWVYLRLGCMDCKCKPGLTDMCERTTGCVENNWDEDFMSGDFVEGGD